MFPVFPCEGKIPLIKNWCADASTDPEVHKMWADLFRGRLTCWGIPTGPTTGIYVLDVDVKGNGFESLKAFPVPQTMFQHTPSGGAHFIFKYPNDGQRHGSRVKFLPGLDTRGDGGYICFYGAEPAPIAEVPPWLMEKMTTKAAPPAAGEAVKVAPEIAAGMIQSSLDAIREAPEGESNNVLNIESFKVGQLCASGSVTREYAEAALLRAARERGKPEYESKRTIESGLDGGAKKPMVSPFGSAAPIAGILIPPLHGPRWTPGYFEHQDLLNTSKLRKPQLFQDWSTEDIHITTADGGTGKTTLKLFEAINLALGTRFLGFNCSAPGKTLFITGEDTDKKLAAMIGQILRQMGMLEDPKYNDQIRTVLKSIVVKKDADLCLIVKDRTTGFLQPSGDAMRKILEACDDIEPKMIVFDPISSFWGSDSALNDMNKAVTKFMSELTERTGACVEMINHMGKQSSATKDMSQFAGRGGSGLPSNARVSRVLRSVFDDEYLEMTGESLLEKQSAMLCNVNKFTDGSPLYNKPFLILRDGYLFSRKLLTDQKIKEAEKNLTDIERVFSFIKESRSADKYPTQTVAVAYFMTNGSPISEARVKRAIQMLNFEGHMGEKIKYIEHPDQMIREKAIVTTDMDGKEN